MASKQINGQWFQWDDEKAEINKRKHGIRFETAAKVFQDENRILQKDEQHSRDEDRWQIIGEVNGILFVVYTEREDSTRLIMARKATPRERNDYYARKKIY